MYKPNQLARIEAGLCFDCGEPLDNETMRCTVCREIAAERSRKRQSEKYTDARIRGVCLDCGIPAENVRCQGCEERHQSYDSPEKKEARAKALKEKRENKSLCVTCGLVPPTTGDNRCANCLEKSNKRYANTRAKSIARAEESGLCRSCEYPHVGKSLYCLYHYVNYIVTSSRLDKKLVPDLVAKAESQKMLCAYTKVPLVPGGNMSLEHVKCQAKYPKLINEITNLVWVDLPTNRAKRDMELLDFVSMGKKLAANEAENARIATGVVFPPSSATEDIIPTVA